MESMKAEVEWNDTEIHGELPSGKNFIVGPTWAMKTIPMTFFLMPNKPVKKLVYIPVIVTQKKMFIYD